MTGYERQVKKKHYSFAKYYYPGRWMSYWHETDEILRKDDILSVLDVGPGSDLLKNILQSFKPDLVYKTLDIAPDLNPDYIGSVTEIPLPDCSFEAVVAFQVLEHIRFEDFENAINELHRVSKKYVMISLPHFGPSLEMQIKIPFLRRLRISAKIPWPKKHVFGGQHYWELGKRGYPVSRVRKKLEKKFKISNEYVPFENQYHRFFIMEK